MRHNIQIAGELGMKYYNRKIRGESARMLYHTEEPRVAGFSALKPGPCIHTYGLTFVPGFSSTVIRS